MSDQVRCVRELLRSSAWIPNRLVLIFLVNVAFDVISDQRQSLLEVNRALNIPALVSVITPRATRQLPRLQRAYAFIALQYRTPFGVDSA
jgi:hypothetical protein